MGTCRGRKLRAPAKRRQALCCSFGVCPVEDEPNLRWLDIEWRRAGGWIADSVPIIESRRVACRCGCLSEETFERYQGEDKGETASKTGEGETAGGATGSCRNQAEINQTHSRILLRCP